MNIAAQEIEGDMPTGTSSIEAMLGSARSGRPVATLADLCEIVRTLPSLDGVDKDFLNIEGVQLEIR